MKAIEDSSRSILLIAVLLGVAGILAAGCNSTTAASHQPAASQPEEPVVQESADDTSPSETGSTTVKLDMKPTADSKDPASSDIYSDRAEPFSEEKVIKLESMLKPIESVPTKAD